MVAGRKEAVARSYTLASRARARSAGADAWVENRPSTSWLPRVDLRELWAYRELALFLALRDLKVRYKQTFFGIAWAVIQPLAAVVVFSVVFGRLVGVPSDDVPYPVFVYVGMIAWIYFSTGLDEAAQSLVEKSALVTKVYFPRILAPLAALLPGLVDLGISALILAALMAAFGVVPGIAIVLLPAWVLALVAVAFGAGLWLSALNAQYRDVRHALPFLIQVWLFASPVVYPSSLVDGPWSYVYALNPMAGVVEGLRWSLVGAAPPGPHVFVSLGATLVLLASGIAYFQRAERRFADVI